MKVAIIEDDKSIINAINVAFEFRWPDASVVSAMTGKEGIDLVKTEAPEVVILDINLPDISGFEVLKKIREFSSVPVIILTVRFDDADVLKGLETGADDYIVKPFNYLTLLARVRAVLRRTERISFKESHNISMSPRLNIDFINQKVRVDNQLIKLTPIEYQLLILLVKNKDQIVSYQQIMEEVWGKSMWEDTDNLRIYIRRLRKKLGDIPPRMILNQHGAGYIFKS
ncbi:MAG: two component transcriptional regulator, winged helix family [Chloroflexi bacterium]|nr:two component transcriptional regulator, winged helix family [Chloroflexota bacterium]